MSRRSKLFLELYFANWGHVLNTSSSQSITDITEGTALRRWYLTIPPRLFCLKTFPVKLQPNFQSERLATKWNSGSHCAVPWKCMVTVDGFMTSFRSYLHRDLSIIRGHLFLILQQFFAERGNVFRIMNIECCQWCRSKGCVPGRQSGLITCYILKY